MSTDHRFVFVDVECTGLDAWLHQIVELAWAVDDGPINVVRPRHTLRHADPKALQVNRYHERKLGDESKWNTAEQVGQFVVDARGATLVAACPHLDASMLTAHFGHAPWRYRLFDIQVYAAGVLDLDLPPSLRELRTELVQRGYKIDEPDHTAGADVHTLRQSYEALRTERRKLVAA